MADELPELILPHAASWREWLGSEASASAGVWLVLAKKGTVAPTSLTYDQALEEALCHGWIDGQIGRRDGATYRQRFTPRRPKSGWSRRNVGLVERLMAEGRMQASGRIEVERAQADGRWEAAYAGSATIEVPADLSAALDASPAAKATWEALNRANRYAVLYRIDQAKRPETRARRVEQLVAMLARGETIHPQRAGLSQKAPRRSASAQVEGVDAGRVDGHD
jgi:uncharacterized protein YdeI (YjbR/CyaY-like superfamily)